MYTISCSALDSTMLSVKQLTSKRAFMFISTIARKVTSSCWLGFMADQPLQVI